MLNRVHSRFGAGLMAFAIVLANAVVPASQAFASDPAPSPEEKKVTVCQRTDSTTNPYVIASISESAALNRAKNEINGKVGVYPATPWGDIIPSFTYVTNNGPIGEAKVFAGLNWTTEGQAIYNNGCAVPAPEPTPAVINATATWGTTVVCGPTNDGAYVTSSHPGAFSYVTAAWGLDPTRPNTYGVTYVVNSGYTVTVETETYTAGQNFSMWYDDNPTAGCSQSTAAPYWSGETVCGPRNDPAQIVTFDTNALKSVARFEYGNTTNPDAYGVTFEVLAGYQVTVDGTTYMAGQTFTMWWVDENEPCPVDEACTVSDNVFLSPWTYGSIKYPEAGGGHWVGNDWVEGGIPGSFKFVNDLQYTGLRITTPEDGSYVTGLIDAGNTRLDNIDALAYTTYRLPESAGYEQTLPAYILLVDIDGDSATTNDRTYLFYEPYYNGTVVEGAWQTWDAYANGTARWYQAGTGQQRKSWSQFVSEMQNARVLAYGFNQGTDNAQTDAFIKSITFDCATTTFSAPGRGGMTPPTTTPVDTPTTPTPATTPVTVAQAKTQLPAELPMTGPTEAGSAKGLLLALIAALATYGAVYFAQGKRRYE